MADKAGKQIENPWVIYGLITKFIGRVVDESRNHVSIESIEEQRYAHQYWRPDSVKRFKKFNEAIDYVLTKSQEYSREQLTEKVLDDFPKAIRQESYQQIHDILYAYSLRQLKDTEPPKDFIEEHCCPNFPDSKPQSISQWEDEGGRVISKCPYADAHARLSHK